MAWDDELEQLMTRAQAVLGDEATDAAICRVIALGMHEEHPDVETMYAMDDEHLKVELRRLLQAH